MSDIKIIDLRTPFVFDDKKWLLDDFLDKLNRNLGEINYSICYEEDSNKFKVIFKGIEVYLILDESIMEEYKNDVNNALITKLKQVVLKNKIINDAKRGLIVNDEARKTYLEYLKKKKKFSVVSYLVNFTNDLGESLNRASDTKIGPYSDEYYDTECGFWCPIDYFPVCVSQSLVIFLVVLFLNSIFGTSAAVSASLLDFKGIWFCLLPEFAYLAPVINFLISFPLLRLARLFNFFVDRSYINKEIKKLKRKINRGTITKKVCGNLDEKSFGIIEKDFDKFLKELYVIVEKLNNIKLTESYDLLIETKRIAISYKNSNYCLTPDIKTRFEMLKQRVDGVVANIRAKESCDNNYFLLMAAIDNCSSVDDKVVGGVKSRAKIKPEQQ